MSSMLPKIPRFYINELEYLHCYGYDFGWSFPKQFRTLPVIPSTIETVPLTNYHELVIDFPIELNNPFIFTLGHNGAFVVPYNSYTNPVHLFAEGTTVNDNTATSPEISGWSLACLNGIPNYIKVRENFLIGSLVVGSFWEPPHSVDLNVKMTFDYSGTKNIKTRGGSTLSNTSWTRNPKWGDIPAWELDRPEAQLKLSKTGRRIWDIGFSFFTESNLLPNILNTSIGDDSTASSDTYLADTLHNDATDFYSQVITKTLGCGNRPFIFSPDSTSTTLDNFAICTFDAKRFSLNQTSPNLYSTKMRIVETW